MPVLVQSVWTGVIEASALDVCRPASINDLAHQLENQGRMPSRHHPVNGLSGRTVGPARAGLLRSQPASQQCKGCTRQCSTNCTASASVSGQGDRLFATCLKFGHPWRSPQASCPHHSALLCALRFKSDAVDAWCVRVRSIVQVLPKPRPWAMTAGALRGRKPGACLKPKK